MILLDTCAVVWIGNREPMSAASIKAVRDAASRGELLVSPVSGWEIGLATTRRKAPLLLMPTPQRWFADFLSLPGVRIVPLEPDVALEASYLPGQLHRDPADRLLIATARGLGVPLVTRDERILDYAAEGHVLAIAC